MRAVPQEGIEDRDIEPFAEMMTYKIGADEPSAACHQHTSRHGVLPISMANASPLQKNSLWSAALKLRYNNTGVGVLKCLDYAILEGARFQPP